MVRKVFKSGNSLVVTLPPEVRDIGIDAGSLVDVEIRDGFVVINPQSSGVLLLDLLDWTDSFVSRHRELLERLA